MKWQFEPATEYRCIECGATGDHQSPDWRWDGNQWQHRHGGGVQGWYLTFRKNPLKNNPSALDLLKKLRQRANNFAPPALLEEVDAFIKQSEPTETKPISKEQEAFDFMGAGYKN